MRWEEREHPRDRRGRFREKGTADWSRLASERLGAASGYVDEGGRFEGQERLEETIAQGVRGDKGRRLSGGVVENRLRSLFETERHKRLAGTVRRLT